MTLDQLLPGDDARVVDIRGGRGLCQRLNHLGLHAGDTVRMSGRGAFHGPLLVNVHGMQVAIGRGIARHVLVEPLGRASSTVPVPGRRFGRRHGRRRGPLR